MGSSAKTGKIFIGGSQEQKRCTFLGSKHKSDIWHRTPPPPSTHQTCCDMGQNDTIGKIELNPSFVLSSDETNYKNDIQLFLQLFDELSVNRDYH